MIYRLSLSDRYIHEDMCVCVKREREREPLLPISFLVRTPHSSHTACLYTHTHPTSMKSAYAPTHAHTEFIS